MAGIPVHQLIPAEPVGFAAKGQRPQRDLDAVPVGQAAERLKHHRPIARARSQSPESMERASPLARPDQLHPPPARAQPVHKRVRPLASRRGNGAEVFEKWLHEIPHPPPGRAQARRKARDSYPGSNQGGVKTEQGFLKKSSRGMRVRSQSQAQSQSNKLLRLHSST